MSNTNLQYKDRLFRFLFGTEQNKSNALDLYNAVNKTSHSNIDELTFDTIDDVLYLGMKNDTSFIFEDYLNLYEQQSSYNPNMPLRGIMYYGKLMGQYIKTNMLNAYGEKKLTLPTPRYIVFYNGTKDAPDIEELRLTSSFEKPDDACAEFVATVININAGHNEDILNRCRTLKEYSEFIKLVRTFISQEGNDTESLNRAVDKAVKHAIEHDILKDCLLKFRSEVIDMVLTEYDREYQSMLDHRDGYNEGLDEGLAKAARNFVPFILSTNPEMTEEQAFEKALEIAKSNKDN